MTEYCHPADDPRRRWLLVFEDAEQPSIPYFDEAEAHRNFEQANHSWNCHLFESCVQRPMRPFMPPKRRTE